MTVLLGRRVLAVVVATACLALSALIALTALAAPAHADRAPADQVPADRAHLDRAAAGAYPGYRLALAAPRLVVCAKDSKSRIGRLSPAARTLNEGLLTECAFHDLQDAVDAVWRRGTTIYVLPGRYREATVAIVGDGTPGCVRCDLQLEGTGDHADDVVIDGGFTRDGDWARRVGVYAAHANGLYLRNLTAQRYGVAGIEVDWTDGLVIDNVTGRWNGSYGMTAVGDDHGIIDGCAVTGNSAAGIATAPVAGVAGARPTVEVRRCRSTGNLVGYTGGDSVYVHDNEFTGNAVGISTDSGALQRHGSFIANRIHGNNANPYGNVWAGRCAKPPRDRDNDVLCPATAVPVGTGLVLSTGQQNTYAGNLIYDNWRSGASQLAYARGNRWMGNLMGITPAGTAAPNGLDFWWDRTGEQNCWQDNASSWGGVRSVPPGLPDCTSPSGVDAGVPTWQTISACAAYVPASATARKGVRPSGCPWIDTPHRPAPR
jgi:parallel beta helix pectate lyase-like protein